MSLTTHFTVAEFAQRAWSGGPAMPYPEEWIEFRLRPLCEMLELVRQEFGKAIHINSGYRSPAFNKALPGTAKKSQHTLGRAADIVVAGVAAPVVHAGVLRLIRSGKLPLVKGLGAYATFTHIDIRVDPATGAPPVRLARWTGSRSDN